MSEEPGRGLDGIFGAARRVLFANASLFVPPLLFPWLGALWWLGLSACLTLAVGLAPQGLLAAVLGALVCVGASVVALLFGGGYLAGWGEMTARAAGTGRTTILDFFSGIARHTWRFASGIASLGVCLAGFALLCIMGVYVAERLPAVVFGPQAARLHLVSLVGGFWSACSLAFVIFASAWQPAAVVDGVGGRWALARSFGFVRRHWPTVLGILAISLVAHGIVLGLAVATQAPVNLLVLTAHRSTVANLAFFTSLLVLELYLVVWAVLAAFFKLAQFIAYIDLSAELVPPEAAEPDLKQALGVEAPAEVGA